MERLVALLGQPMVDGLKNLSEEKMNEAIVTAGSKCLPPLMPWEILPIVGMLKDSKFS